MEKNEWQEILSELEKLECKNQQLMRDFRKTRKIFKCLVILAWISWVGSMIGYIIFFAAIV